MFQRYVASVSFGCYKSILECCICCNGYTCMLQAYVPNVSSVFRRMLQMCLFDVAYVSHICCKCFIWMLHMFHTYGVSVCSKYFICFILMLHSSVLCCKYFVFLEVCSQSHEGTARALGERGADSRGPTNGFG